MSKTDILVVLAIPRYSRNPSLDLLYAEVEKAGITVHNGNRREIMTGQYDLVHYNWVEAFLNLPSRRQRWSMFLKRFLLILVLKWRRKKSVWTMYDLKPHEQQGNFLPSLYRLIFFWSIDGLITLSDAATQIMRDRYPALRSKPMTQIRDGNFRAHYPHAPTKDAAKERAGLAAEDVVIGFFGSIRPYKNVPHLVRVFKQLADPSLRLIIAGACQEDAMAQELVVLTANDPNIKLRMEFVADEDVPWTVGAVDLMVLPFTQTLNSASIILALSFNVPVLVPAEGSLVEVAEEVGPAWVRTYTGTLTPEILTAAIQWAAQPRPTPAPIDHHDWEVCGKKTADFLRAIAQGG